MNGAVTWLGVAMAGGLGAVARFLVDLGVSHLLTGPTRPATEATTDGTVPQRPSRPRLGTIIVNVTGSLLAGMVAGSAIAGHLGVEVETVVAGGFLGAYTTFSTAMFQAVTVFEERRPMAATANLITTLVLAVAAAWCGVVITT